MAADTASAVFVLHAEQQQRYFELGAQPEEAASYLAEALQLPEHKHHARSAVKLDYVTYVLQLARELQLGPNKAAALLGIAQALLELCTAGGTFDQAQLLLRTQLMARCSARPAPDDDQLSPDKIARIAQFFAQTFFQHFALYSHVTCCEQEHTAYTAELLVETARVPLFEGVLTELEWDAAKAARAEQQEQQRTAAEAAAQEAHEREVREQEEQQRQQEEQARQEELTKKPKTLDEAVEQLVALRLEEERQQLAQQYAAKEVELMARLAALEGPPGSKAAAKK